MRIVKRPLHTLSPSLQTCGSSASGDRKASHRLVRTQSYNSENGSSPPPLALVTRLAGGPGWDTGSGAISTEAVTWRFVPGMDVPVEAGVGRPSDTRKPAHSPLRASPTPWRAGPWWEAREWKREVGPWKAAKTRHGRSQAHSEREARSIKLVFWGGFVFCLFRATPSAYGSSQARDGIRAAAGSLHHSHSNARSEPHR